MLPRPLTPLALALLLAACNVAVPPEAPPTAAPSIDGQQLLEDLRTLSSAEMEGRRMGSAGHARAQAYIRQRFAEVGLEPLADGRFDLPIRYVPRGDSVEQDGTNFAGVIRGTVDPERYLVVTAHYDHLGIRDGEIYYGADDNASGTAALFALAEALRQRPPRHSVLFVALDAEEVGLRGARAFVADPPLPLDAIALNVNMDMVSRSETGELYAAGTYHYPFLFPLVERVAERAPVTLLTGHDRPDLPPGDDWTLSSDHGAFHEVGIPFIYFGVEDHPGYHNPTDTFENITPEFYVRAVTTVLDFVREADAELAEIHAARMATVED
jgi:hypothetical protein